MIKSIKLYFPETYNIQQWAPGEGVSMAFLDNIPNGITEIAGLAALVGSSTAESLTLGNRGAPGLPWVAVSVFGSFSVVRTCVAAATPDWLRETLGVRNQSTDSSIGLSLNLRSKYMDREEMARRNMRDAIGIMSVKEKSSVCLTSRSVAHLLVSTLVPFTCFSHHKSHARQRSHGKFP